MSVSTVTTSASEQAKRFKRLERRVQLRYLVLLLPALIFLFVFYGYPVAAMLARSFKDPVLGLDNFRKLTNVRRHDEFFFLSIPSNGYIHVFLITLRIAGVVTLLTLVLGYPVAYVLSSIRDSRANLLLILVLIPFWTSILVRSYAWMVLLGREGSINRILIDLGFRDEPMQLLNTRFAVYVGMVHILLPFMILPLYSVMRGIDRSYLRAASNLGAATRGSSGISSCRCLPGVAAGCLVVFILSLGFYITPALIGGQKDIMISMLIAQQVNTAQVGLRSSARACAAGDGAADLPDLQQGAGRGQAVRRDAQVKRFSLTRIILYIVTGLVLFYLIFPIFVVIPVSFSSASYLQFPPPGFSLQWYRKYFDRADWIDATWLSIWIACVTAILATILGTMASLALVRGRFRGKGLANAFMVSPLVIPGIIVAIGVYFFYARIQIVGSPWALALAHTALALPFVVINVSATLYGFDERLEYAAMNLGANRWQTFRYVTFPIIRPGVFAGALFAFITSFDELIVALFISGTGAVTLPRKMWDGLGRRSIRPSRRCRPC